VSPDLDTRFEAAFPRLFTRAFSVAHRVLGHTGEAEDVAAEALARTLRAWRKVHAMDAPDAWVARVATNLAIDVARRRRFTADDAAGDGAGKAVAPGWLEDVDTRLLVGELVRTLPRRQREVLALRYLADLSEAEIAAVLGIAPGSVKAHASRGIERLRQRVTGTRREAMADARPNVPA
jgi:RNA polymerase sigma factor (sigma-70 family)